MADDDKNLNKDDPTVIANDSEAISPMEETSENLPVEEAGLLEAPDTEDESTSPVIPTEEEPADDKSEETESAEPVGEVAADDVEAEESISEELKTEEPTTDQPVTENGEPKTDDSDSPGRWYVVHTYSGHENKVATTLKQRVESEHLTDKIFDVLVPTQDKIEIRGGRKTEVKEKIFPGYILVKMLLDDISWLAVRTTQGVTSFVGMGNKPTAIPNSEVASIVKFTQIQQPTFKQLFSVDDTVKIVDGPFAEFIGKVDSVDEEKGKVRVLVSIFGRETPVELDFLQVQKI